jgi:hypothetical protein
MEITIEAPLSFSKLSKQQQKAIVEEIQSELEKKTSMIEGFQQSIEDFDDWEKLGFESELWS